MQASLYFFLFPFGGANGYRNQSPLLGLSDFKGLGVIFPFHFAFLGAFLGEMGQVFHSWKHWEIQDMNKPWGAAETFDKQATKSQRLQKVLYGAGLLDEK